MKSNTKYYIDNQQIVAIFDNANLGKVSKICPLDEGEFNSAYMVDAGGKEYVVKIAPKSNKHLLTYEQDLMAQEVEFYRLIQEKTDVVTPKIYFCDDTKSILDSPYFIMEKLTSSPLVNAQLSKEERDIIYEKVGEAVAKFHTIKGDKFGYVQNGLHDNWYLALKAMIQNLCDDCARYNKKCKYAKKLMSYVEKHKDILVKVESTYTHFDIWDGNVFFEKQDGDVSVALIDMERGFWGDGIADFVNIEMFVELNKKQSVKSYNKTATSPIVFSREEIVRFNVMRAYLGLIVYTEKFARYKRNQAKYWINVVLAKMFLTASFRELNKY